MNANQKEVNWIPSIFLISYHVFLLVSLPIYFYYYTPSWGLVAASVILLYLTGFSITGGYHRYYSHRSYRTSSPLECVILFFASMAGQGSALRWSFDHRLHHAHVDTDEDPYSIKKGFWYAHCLWILEKPRTIDPKIVPDLMKNKLVMFQHRYFPLLMLITNVMAFLFVGWLLNDYVGAFFIAMWTRLLCLHHFTWFINSLAHTWGDKPFSQEHTAVNNYIISLLTFGEGYHNYHHTFANDYRNGVYWYQFDPTKWILWTCHKLGLVHDLKRTDDLTIKKRMVIEHKTLLLEKISTAWHAKKEDLESTVNEISERIVAKISEFGQLKEQYKQMLKNSSEGDTLSEVNHNMKTLKKSIREDWKLWSKLSRNIMELRPS